MSNAKAVYMTRAFSHLATPQNLQEICRMLLSLDQDGRFALKATLSADEREKVDAVFSRMRLLHVSKSVALIFKNLAT